MKKLLTVLMALGLVMAIAMPAAAVDVKISGSWYMAGWYVDNASGLDKGSTYATDPSWGKYAYDPATSSTAGDSRHNRGAAAYYTSKLTLAPTIQVVEGLSLKTSLSALQTMMGDNSWKGTPGGRYTPTTSTIPQYQAASGVFIQENIDITSAYVDFKTRYGQWQAGYISRPNFGTIFLNDPYVWTGIRYQNVMGPMTYTLAAYKTREWKNRNNYGTVTSTNGVANDSDGDIYQLSGIYKFKAGEAGLMYDFWRDARSKSSYTNSTTNAGDGTSLVPNGLQGYLTVVSTINPYAKLRFGNVYIEGEAYYKFGNWRKYEVFATGNTQQPDVAISAYGAYLNGRVDFKPVYVGGIFTYMSGDDMSNVDKVTGSVAQFSGENYLPVANTLILWNNDLYDSMGSTVVGNIAGTSASNPRTGQNLRGTRYLDNVWLYQIYGGMNITPKMSVEARLTYATADKKPKLGVGAVGETLTNNTAARALAGQVNKEFVSDKYGTEFDVTASYKIFDNLTYTAGAGYLWIGEYFKGYDNDAKLKDNYILTHKLTLSF